MKRIRYLLLSAGLGLAITACDRHDDAGVDPAGNALLAHVPADTPYVAANLAPLPEDVVDGWLLRLQPVLDEMQVQLSRARADLDAHGGEPDDPGQALLLALLRELDGKLNRPGLESLGLDIGGHRVVYGLGAFPVLRLGLSDPAALRDAVVRVLEGAGLPAAELEWQGVRYWRLGAPEGEEAPVALYVSIRDDHLAAAVLPALAEPELLPAFLGLEMPVGPDAGQRLAALNRERGYTPYGSAIVDLHRLADDFLQPDGLVHRLLAAEGELDTPVTPECAAEIHSIIDNVPQISAGTTELTVTDIRYRYHLQAPANLASRLLPLASRIPVVDEVSERMLELAFGLRFGPVRDFLREQAAAVIAEPYACSHLQDLNDWAAELEIRLAQPMPPFVNNFRGVRISIDDVSLTGDYLNTTANGHLALHVEQPEMFVGMAQMFLPDLSALTLAAGEPPVQLPPSLLPRPDIVAFAAMSSDAIGLSVGAGEETSLPGFLDRKPGPEGSFLSFGYDMAAYLDYSDAIEELARGGRDDPAYGDSGHVGAEAARAVGEAARQAFRAMADRNRTEVRFVEDGVLIEGHLSFKPLP